MSDLQTKPVLIIAVLIGVLILWSGCGGEPGNRVEDLTSMSTIDISPPPKPAPPTTQQTTEAEQVQAQIQTILSAYNLDAEFAHITELASDHYQGRRSGSAGAEMAASYISSRFASLGLVPWSELGLSSFSHHFSRGGVEDDNVIGVLPGSASGFVILGAHYDHLGVDAAGRVYNGADDNAAGVAAVLEAARIIGKSGLRPQKSIVFCAFSGEEQGQFGAEALGSLISSQGLVDSVEMINIDGIGATGGSYFGVWDEGADNAAPIVAAIQQAGAFLGIAVREEGTDIGSDAQPFDWQFGIPAVTVDWNWGQDESAFHPYYHTVDDDPDKISQTALEQASRVAIASLWLRAASTA